MKKLEKKDRLELIVTVILIIVFIVLVAAVNLHKSTASPDYARTAPTIFRTKQYFKDGGQRNKGTSFILNNSYGDIARIKRNPFSYGVSGNNQEAGRLSNLSLTGIIWNITKPSAVINGQTVAVGDVIENFKVTQIKQDSVVIENANSRLELKLNQGGS